MTDVQTLLRIEKLAVNYGRLQALRDISLRLQSGERVALLGHNGAGKSTLFKAILGFLPPVAGSVSVASHAPGSKGAREVVSYLPEAVAFPKSLTGAEIMTYFARLKGADVKRALGLLDRVGMAQAASRPVGSYSKGMRQRLGLAQALIGSPRLLLLDEPTSGLDPVSRRDLYQIIDSAVAGGAAVLHSSHSLSEVEGHTDRIVILSQGQLVAEGSLAELAREAQLPITVRIQVRDGQADAIQSRFGGTRLNGRSVVVSCTQPEKVELLARIAALGDSVSDFDFAMPSLDDVYKYFSDQASGRADR